MDGRVVQVAPPERLFHRPADLRIARFLQLSNLFPVDAVEGSSCTVRGVSLRLDAPHEGPRERPWLSVAAEDILALRPGEAALLGIEVNRLPGRVLRVDVGHRRPRAEVAIGGSDDLVLCWEIPARERLAPGAGVCAGDEVELHLPPRALALFPEEAQGFPR